jgi:beta-1,4-mannosyltransferase
MGHHKDPAPCLDFSLGPEFARPIVLASPKRIALNPYFETISDGLERQGWRVREFSYLRALLSSLDILHMHNPGFPFNNRQLWITAGRLLILAAILMLLRVRHKKIVWTVHNLAHHERHHPALERRFMNWVSARLDLSVHLSESGRAAAFERFPRLRSVPFVVIPHPHYAEARYPLPSPEDAASALGLPRKALVLFFGQIRPYKNVPELIRVFSRLQSAEIGLVIAGMAPEPRLESEVRRAAAGDERIILRFGRIPEDEVATYFSAASLVVLPYREILNSGAALLSLTHKRPLLVPDQGAMAELKSKVGATWVRLFTPPLRPEDLAAAISWAGAGREAGPDLAYFAPSAIAKAHACAFARLLAPPRRTQVEVELAGN